MLDLKRFTPVTVFEFLSRQNLKPLIYITTSISLLLLSCFCCVSIWDSHLEKVHFMEMELLEKKN